MATILETSDLRMRCEQSCRSTAESHAEQRLGDATDPLSQVCKTQIAFELGSIDAQQGRLEDAVARYRRAIDLTAPPESVDIARWHILAHNNLAYHLYLLNQPHGQ